MKLVKLRKFLFKICFFLSPKSFYDWIESKDLSYGELEFYGIVDLFDGKIFWDEGVDDLFINRK